MKLDFIQYFRFKLIISLVRIKWLLYTFYVLAKIQYPE
jgi:hypothetical protein